MLVYNLVGSLDIEQVIHRCHDPTDPPHPDITGMKDMEEFEAAIKKWSDASREHRERSGFKVRPHAPLEALWPMIDPPDSLSPLSSNGDDLVFKDFALCQRYIQEKPAPAWSPERHYIVGIPTGTESFRCVVLESLGRRLCTTTSHSQCKPPAADDFKVVRMSGMCIVSFRPTERRPGVIKPSSWVLWQLGGSERPGLADR
jgi:hypothetical protein